MAIDDSRSGGNSGSGSPREEQFDYLDREVNILKPATPFMRANLRMIFSLFAVWLVFVFGPVTASYFVPELVTEIQILGGYPLHFFLTAMVAPAAALVLAAIYAWYRDRLDTVYRGDNPHP